MASFNNKVNNLPSNDSYQAIPSWSSSPKSKKSKKSTGPKRRFRTWVKVILVIFGIVVVLSIVAQVAFGGAIKASQKVSDSFISDIQAGNASEAYALGSGKFKASASETALSNLLQQHAASLRGQRTNVAHRIMKYSGQPEMASFVYKINSATGTSYAKTVLQKDSSNWRIVNFYVSKSVLSPAI